MMTPDQTTEAAIVAAGANVAPRIRPADIAANIVGEYYFTAADGLRYNWITEDHASGDVRESVQRIADSIPGLSHASTSASIDGNANTPASLGLLTFCVLTLVNGFTVTGESACVSPENFSAEIGRRIARENAIAKIWPLMGYALKQRLHDEAQRPVLTLADSIADLEGTPRPDHQITAA